MAVVVSVLIILSKPPIPPPAANNGLPGLASLGQIDRSFDEFLDKIKKDIGFENIEITAVVGPYFLYSGISAALYNSYGPRYYILLDQEFFSELILEEKKAVLAHEAGHILFRLGRVYNMRKYTANEVLADTFAARYVNPKNVIGSLDKAYSNYLVRRKHLETLAQGQ